MISLADLTSDLYFWEDLTVELTLMSRLWAYGRWVGWN